MSGAVHPDSLGRRIAVCLLPTSHSVGLVLSHLQQLFVCAALKVSCSRLLRMGCRVSLRLVIWKMIAAHVLWHFAVESTTDLIDSIRACINKERDRTAGVSRWHNLYVGIAMAVMEFTTNEIHPKGLVFIIGEP